MLRCVTTHSTRSTHRRTPAPYSQGMVIRSLLACEFVPDRFSCHGTKCHSRRVTIRYSHASRLRGAPCPSSVRVRIPRTITPDSVVKGLHGYRVKILVSCYTEGLSHETQGRETCETTQTRREDAPRARARCARARAGVLALVRVGLASQAACSRKRKRIRWTLLDGAALASTGATICAVVTFSACRTSV